MTEAPGSLRLDLLLKRSRLVKRRPLAALLCREGHVLLNGRETGPGKEVRPGDRVRVRLLREVVEVEVVSLPGRGEDPEGCLRTLSRERVEDDL